jgi:hypothetical protein
MYIRLQNSKFLIWWSLRCKPEQKYEIYNAKTVTHNVQRTIKIEDEARTFYIGRFRATFVWVGSIKKIEEQNGCNIVSISGLTVPYCSFCDKSSEISG